MTESPGITLGVNGSLDISQTTAPAEHLPVAPGDDIRTRGPRESAADLDMTSSDVVTNVTMTTELVTSTVTSTGDIYSTYDTPVSGMLRVLLPQVAVGFVFISLFLGSFVSFRMRNRQRYKDRATNVSVVARVQCGRATPSDEMHYARLIKGRMKPLVPYQLDVQQFLREIMIEDTPASPCSLDEIMFEQHSGWPGDEEGSFRYICDGDPTNPNSGGQDNPAYEEDNENSPKSHERSPPDGRSQQTQRRVCASCGKVCAEAPSSGSQDALHKATYPGGMPSGSASHPHRKRGHRRSGSYAGLFSRRSSPSRSSSRSLQSDAFGVNETAFYSLGKSQASSSKPETLVKNSTTRVSFIQGMMARR